MILWHSHQNDSAAVQSPSSDLVTSAPSPSSPSPFTSSFQFLIRRSGFLLGGSMFVFCVGRRKEGARQMEDESEKPTNWRSRQGSFDGGVNGGYFGLKSFISRMKFPISSLPLGQHQRTDACVQEIEEKEDIYKMRESSVLLSSGAISSASSRYWLVLPNTVLFFHPLASSHPSPLLQAFSQKILQKSC